jgi:hypothetical protein
MNKHGEMIEKFHERMKNQILKEYHDNGTIETKVILLLLDPNEKPVLTYKTVPRILNSDDNFTEKYLALQKDIRKLADASAGDGYDVVCLLHVEYDAEMERVHTSLKKGENLRESDIFEYRLVKGSTCVQADGSIMKEKPKFELIPFNW